MDILKMCVLGSFSGVLGGAFALAGPELIIPGVMMLNLVPDIKTAIGTVQFMMLWPTSILAVLEFRRVKKINYTVGIWLTILFTIFAYFGSFLNTMMSDKQVHYGCAIIFVIVGMYFLYKGYLL